MNYIYSAIGSFIVGMLVFFVQSLLRENHKLKQKNKQASTLEHDSIRSGIICILRDTLITNHRKYKQRGSISTNGLQNWLLMFDAYKNLGGNGMVDKMKEEIEELPIA